MSGNYSHFSHQKRSIQVLAYALVKFVIIEKAVIFELYFKRMVDNIIRKCLFQLTKGYVVGGYNANSFVIGQFLK